MAPGETSTVDLLAMSTDIRDVFRLPRNLTAIRKEDLDSAATTSGASIVDLPITKTAIQEEFRLLGSATALGCKEEPDSGAAKIADSGQDTGDNTKAADNDSVTNRLRGLDHAGDCIFAGLNKLALRALISLEEAEGAH